MPHSLHTKDGIYGEMFIAAAISVALVSDDLDKVINAALSQVPEKSRLMEVVKNVINWSKKANNWQEVWQRGFQRRCRILLITGSEALSFEEDK